MKILRLIVVGFSGGIGGALLGAIILGGTTFIFNHGDRAATYFGPANQLWKMFSLVGAIYGVAPGFLIGLFVGGSRCDQAHGAFSGLIIGSALTALFLRSVLNTPTVPYPYEESIVFQLLLATAPIPFGALLGLVLSEIGFRFETTTPRQLI
jgi:hypothetical protein